MIAAGLVMMVDESGKGCAALRACGDSRYVGGAEEAHSERIGAFWWRLGWVEECIVTCDESRHCECYVVRSVERLLHHGIIETSRTPCIYPVYLTLPVTLLSRD